jgi:hypothetical protein
MQTLGQGPLVRSQPNRTFQMVARAGPFVSVYERQVTQRVG